MWIVLYYVFMGMSVVQIIGVVRVQHPTVGMRNEFNYGGGFGRVLCPHNTINLAIIIALITRGKYGVGLFMGGRL